MVFASERKLNYKWLLGLATLCCFFSCVSTLKHRHGGYMQNFMDLACPEVCSCALHGLVNCSYRNLTSTPDANKVPTDANVYMLQWNNISYLNGYTFKTTPNLTFLDLYSNKLTDIHDDAFAGLGQLQVLNISFQISDRHRIPPALNISDQTSIQRISRKWFKGLSELTVAELLYIGAKNIDDYAFSDNPNIEEINLDSNYLKYIPTHLFQHLPALKIIRICCNDLTEIDGEPFFGSNNVEEIHLYVNSIYKLHEKTFQTMRNLTLVNLNNNKLTSDEISGQTFRGLRRLTKLYLYKNDLKTIKGEWFEDLISLEQFTAQENSITTFKENVFRNCLNLKEIDLSYNLIVNIPSTLFRGLPTLLNVICSYNKIENIGDDAFQGSNRINSLLFDSNVLKTVSESIGLQHLHNLKEISFYSNPFQCNCDLVWFIRWIHLRNVRPYVYNLDEVNCAGPRSLALRLLLDLDPESFSCKSHVVIIVASTASVLVIIAGVLFYFRWDIRYLHQRRKLRKQYKQLNEDIAGPANMEGNIFDAFISYSSKDCDWILNVLQPTLENEPYNFRLCVDYRDFMPGNSIVDNIARAIRCSRKTIMILTKNFLRSQWCYFELEMARLRLLDNSEDVFIVVLLEKVKAKDIPLKLQHVLRKKSYIRWPDEEVAQRLFWTKLETQLRSPNVI